jgi:hypothetical protein
MRMNEAAIEEKLQRLEVTDDHVERHSLALELADTRDPRVFDALVRLIQRPALENRRGTLVYCLGNYDCSPVVDLLVKLADSGNAEVAMGANGILQEQGLQ